MPADLMEDVGQASTWSPPPPKAKDAAQLSTQPPMLPSIAAIEKALTQQNNLLSIQIQNQQLFRSQSRLGSQHQRNNKTSHQPRWTTIPCHQPAAGDPTMIGQVGCFAQPPATPQEGPSLVREYPEDRRSSGLRTKGRPRGMRYYWTETLLVENWDVARRELRHCSERTETLLIEKNKVPRSCSDR